MCGWGGNSFELASIFIRKGFCIVSESFHEGKSSFAVLYKKLILINEFGRMGLDWLAANALQISMRYLMEYNAHFVDE